MSKSVLFCWFHVATATIVLHVLIEGSSASVDGTLTPNQTGSSVVRAVIAKIDRDVADVFQDSDQSQWWEDNRPLFALFMRRMAYVETKDGLQPSVLEGGIWGVSREVFDMTKAHLSCGSINEIDPIRQRIISSILDVDWCSVDYTDMSVPLYSGLAVTLYVDQLIYMNSGNSPAGPEALSQLWGRFKVITDEGVIRRTWRNRVEELQTAENCTIKSDVVFVIDSSNSITMAQYDKRLGSTITERNKNESLQKIDTAPHLREFTNTADALCKLKSQQWRNDSGVLQIAIVLTDGLSTDRSEECGYANTKEAAELLRRDYPHILVFAIGIGIERDDVRARKEVLDIASREYLTTRYDQLNSTGDVLQYQICSTLSSETRMGGEANGTVARDEIMRWILNDVGVDGVTVRLCVREGSITFYVSQLTTPSEELYDSRSTITTTDGLSTPCSTIFRQTYHTPGTGNRKRRQQAQTSTLYLSIEGHDTMNTFVIQSGDGNVTFDVNECKMEPFPCHESATCKNTDGSYVCICKRGYSGDGSECTSTLPAFLVPSVMLGALLLISCVILVLTVIYVLYKIISKCKKSTKNSTRPTMSASNAMTESL